IPDHLDPADRDRCDWNHRSATILWAALSAPGARVCDDADGGARRRGDSTSTGGETDSARCARAGYLYLQLSNRSRGYSLRYSGGGVVIVCRRAILPGMAVDFAQTGTTSRRVVLPRSHRRIERLSNITLCVAQLGSSGSSERRVVDMDLFRD